ALWCDVFPRRFAPQSRRRRAPLRSRLLLGGADRHRSTLRFEPLGPRARRHLQIHRRQREPVLAAHPAARVDVVGHRRLLRQPPRNSVAHRPDTVTMLMYSARKNSANFSDEYSVWNPPTSSDSASGRSNGARLVSPTADTK